MDSKFKIIKASTRGCFVGGGAHFSDGGVYIFWRSYLRPSFDGVFGFSVFLKKIRPPLEGVFKFQVFFEKIRPPLDGVLGQGQGVYFLAILLKAFLIWCFWIQCCFEESKASPRGCFWIQSFLKK